MSRRAVVALAAVTTFLCALVGPVSSATAPTAPADPAPQGGMVGGAGFAEGSTILWRSDSELAQELDGMVGAGASYLRVDLDWSLVQDGGRSSWNWGPDDRVVSAARARGLKVLGLVAYTPTWARPAGTDDKTPPTNAADFANFAAAATQHYASSVHDFEIWNEPNMTMFFSPRPDPVKYTQLLVAAYNAIKGVDASATVITAGLSPAPDASDGSAIAPVTFLWDVYSAGGGGHFDAVAMHPSNYPYMPMRPEPDNYNYNAFGGVTPMLHQVMTGHGDGAKRIWATEMGAPAPFTVDGHSMNATDLAAYLTEAYSQWRTWTWTGPLFWYSYRDGWSDPSDIEANFGLVTASGAAKGSAVTAYHSAVTSP